MTSSSSCSGTRELMSLAELPMGVELTFKPKDAQLVCYLYYHMMLGHAGNGKQSFPNFDIYGKNGSEPWVIWDYCEGIKFPHQEFLYFYTRVKKMSNNGKGTRLSRTVGCGGTWSETEPAKPVNVDGAEKLSGKLRKFRYENKNKTFEHHSAWMMEEFSIDNFCSDLVLCRIKRNEANKKGKRKRKDVEDEEKTARRTKSFKQDHQLPSLSHEQAPQPQVSDFVPQEWIDVDDFCGFNSDEQINEEQGNSDALRQNPSHQFDDNYNCATGDIIESGNAELEDTYWLAHEFEEVDPSLSEQHISAVDDDLIMSANELTHAQLEGSTDQNNSATYISEENIHSSPLTSQQHHQSSEDDDQAFNFAYDNDFIPMDGATTFRSDECSNFNFHCENQYLSGADNELLLGW